MNGDYNEVVMNVSEFLEHDKIFNFVNGIEIKMSEGKGRGLFTTKKISKGTLLIVERAVIEAV